MIGHAFHDRRGFTLIELLAAAAIFSIAILVSTSVFVSTSQTQRRSQSFAKVQGDARFVLESMSQAVRVDGIDYSYYQNPAGDRSLPPIDLRPAVDELVTKDANGQRTFFRWVGSSLSLGTCVQTAAEATSDPTKCSPDAVYSDITPTGIDITNFKVWIDPPSDPYQPVPASAVDCRTGLDDNGSTQFGFDLSRDVCTCNSTLNLADGTNDQCWPGQACGSSGPAQNVCAPVNRQPRATIAIASSGGSSKIFERVSVSLQTTVSSRTYKR